MPRCMRHRAITPQGTYKFYTRMELYFTMKHSHFSTLGRLSALLFLILLAGCSSSGLSSMTPRERTVFEEAMRQNLTPDELISQAEKKLNEATEAQLEFYAPTTFKTATKLVEEANARLVKKGAKPEEVLLMAIKAKQAIATGFEIKDQVMELLSISLAEKRRLDDIDTHTLFPVEYEAIKDLLNQMISLIEAQKPEEATGMQTQFTEKTAALLIKALDKITLDQARKTLAEAQSKEAKRYAPITFEAANLKLKQAETFLRTYPRDREGIQKIGMETLQAAQHSLMVTREVKIINAIETNAIEGFVLAIEKQIRNVGKSLGQPDIPYDTLRSQLEGLVESAGTTAATAAKVPGLEKTKESLTSDLDAEREKKDALEGKVSGLEGTLASLKADKKKVDESEASLNQENTDLKTQIETLTQSVSEKQAAGEKLNEEKARNLEEITKLESAITEFKIKLEDAENKLAQAETLKAKIQTLETSNKASEEKITSLQSDKERGLDEISKLKVTVNELKETLNQKSADLKQAENKAEDAAQLTATTPGT